jgi:hypothetical protein
MHSDINALLEKVKRAKHNILNTEYSRCGEKGSGDKCYETTLQIWDIIYKDSFPDFDQRIWKWIYGLSEGQIDQIPVDSMDDLTDYINTKVKEKGIGNLLYLVKR